MLTSGLLNADIWATSYTFVTPNMDKTKRPSMHHSKRTTGSKETNVGHKNQVSEATDCPEPVKRWVTQSTIDKYMKGAGARLSNQSESSSSVECVQSDSGLRYGQKRSRTKSVHEDEMLRDATSVQNDKESNSEDSPFLQMLSEDLDVLRSPKNKYIHRSSSKHTKERDDTKKLSSVTSSFEIKKEIEEQDLKTEESPLPCIKKEVSQESDLEEGELVDEPDEKPKPSPKKSKKDRQSNKGKVGINETVSAHDWSGVECPADFTVKSDKELKDKISNFSEGEFSELISMSCIKKESAEPEQPRVDSPLIGDFAQKCRPMLPEEGEIMSPQIDAKGTSSKELIISGHADPGPELKKERQAFSKSTTAIRDHGSSRSHETRTHPASQSVKDTSSSDITTAVLRNMMQNLYSQNTYSHLTASFAETLSWHSLHQPSTLQLPLQPVQSYGLPAQSYTPMTALGPHQMNQPMPTFLMQYKDLCSNLLSYQSPVGYQIPAQTGSQAGQWYTPTTESFLGTSSHHYHESTATSSKVGQKSQAEPLGHSYQNHRSTTAHGSSTIRPHASTWHPQTAQPTVLSALSPGIYSQAAICHQQNLFQSFGTAVLMSFSVLVQHYFQCYSGYYPPSYTISPLDNSGSTTEVSSKLRKWEVLKTVDPRRLGGMEFTLMTYNILAQEYLDQNSYLYSRCNPTHLTWESRGPALIAQIISQNADIVCLQEVQEYHWVNNLKEPLERHGYQHVYQRKSKSKPDGCAVLFKGSKFKKIKFVQVDFKKGGLLDRDNIGLILLLQPIPQGCLVQVPQICIATTHLLFNPKRGDVKLAQLILFLAEIDKHAYLDKGADVTTGGHHSKASSSSVGATHNKGTGSDPKAPKTHSGYCPIILCGDFNAEPFCDMYKFITTGYLKYEKCLSKLLCGQKEGQTGGWSPEVGKEVMPKGLQISQTCQYTHIMRKRYGSAEPPENRMLINSGKVYHDMSFKSVYLHSFVDKHGHHLTEVSSQHKRSSATVDYIFYSSGGLKKEKEKSNQHQTKEAAQEQLELLSRYRLLTTRDIHKAGLLPNRVFPSDHFCLVAKFLLS